MLTRTEDQSPITTAEVAEILGKSRSVIVRRAQAGALPVIAKAPGLRGAYLFDGDVVEAMAATK